MRTTKRVLILGGGFGGVAASRRLRDLLDEGDEVMLVDRATHFMMGFRKTGEVIGREPMDAGMRPLASLERFGIRVVPADITAIDPAARAAEVGGVRVEADALLVALGAETVPDAIPGLVEHGIDWYANDGARAAAAALAGLDKGRVVIGIFGAPYKCPPAPFELALLAHEAAQERGARQTFEVFSPLPMSLPVLGKAGCETIEGRLAGLMIDFRPTTTAERVQDGSVATAQGDIPFDLLLAVPPHRVPAVITDAGLAPAGGWVKVEPHTLATPFEGVWAVGDCIGLQTADGKPMPKAGELAQDAGRVAADRIAAHLAGREADALFFGDGACFLEVGGGEAMIVRGRFLGEDGAQVELTQPSAEHYQEKVRFERERLDEWFG